MLALAGTGYGLIGLLIIILLVVKDLLLRPQGIRRVFAGRSVLLFDDWSERGNRPARPD